MVDNSHHYLHNELQDIYDKLSASQQQRHLYFDGDESIQLLSKYFRDTGILAYGDIANFDVFDEPVDEILLWNGTQLVLYVYNDDIIPAEFQVPQVNYCNSDPINFYFNIKILPYYNDIVWDYDTQSQMYISKVWIHNQAWYLLYYSPEESIDPDVMLNFWNTGRASSLDRKTARQAGVPVEHSLIVNPD